MELTWFIRLRIAAAFAVGALLIGVLAWPIVAGQTPFDPVALGRQGISLGGAMTLAVLAFVSGFIGYFVSWPYGRHIGPIAAPAGLTIWAFRSGSMANLIKENSSVEQQLQLFAVLRFEPIFWLAIVAVGFAGALAADKLVRRDKQTEKKMDHKSKANNYLNAAIGFIGSVLVAQWLIKILVQDYAHADSQLGSVTAQPVVAQIAFGVCVAFGAAAFGAKKLLNLSPAWTIIATAFVTPYLLMTYAKKTVLAYLTEYLPPVFFANSAVAVLPVQIVAFGTLGAIAGYWLGVRYSHWREHEKP